MRRNPLKEKLAAKKPVAGVIIQSESPALVEIAGLAGFDFAFIDAEHGPMSERDCENLVRAAEVTGIVPIIRVSQPQPGYVLRFLDIGAMGIIFPGLRTREEAVQAVRACKYYPLGHRGLSAARAASYGLAMPMPDYVRDANENIMVLGVLETVEGMENLADLLNVEGLDALIIGITDLSQALGVPGQGNHPSVKESFAKILDVARGSGKALGAVVRAGETPQEYIERGVQIVLTTAWGLYSGAAKNFVKQVASGH